MATVALSVGVGLIVGAGIYAATRGRPDMPGINVDEMQQTAKEGEPRIQIWGTVRPIKGNVVAVEDPPRIIRRKQSGGKGGDTPRSEHPYRTYAIGVCEGPISSYRRVWRNNKLVYDGREGSDWGPENNQVFLNKATLYFGDYTQTSDPVLEQIFGVGQVPAMRGTAYMVIEDEDLTDTNGAVPQWTFEISQIGGFPGGNLEISIDAKDAGNGEGLGYLIDSGFTENDTLRITKASGLGFTAWSAWGYDEDPRAEGLPWMNSFQITNNTTGQTSTQWEGSFETADDALFYVSGDEISITGGDSYLIWLEDPNPSDNRGGLYIQVVMDSPEKVIGNVIRDICLKAGVPSSAIDVSDILDISVEGVPLSPASPASDTVTSICDMLQIDVVNNGGVLLFKKRGGASVADITGTDAVEDGGPVQEVNRGDRIAIPKQLILEYYDIEGGLNPDTQTSTRALDYRAVSEVKRKTSIIMGAEDAVRRTQIAHKVAIEEQRGSWEFSLPDSYLRITVGDVITYDGNRLRITETEIEEGLQNYKAVYDRASAYESNATPKPPSQPTEPPSAVVGDTVLYFIDSHILRDADDRLGYYVAISGAGDAWQGALVELSTDGGETYPESIEAGTDAISGELTDSLPVHSRYYPDQINTLSVELLRDDMELESATLAQMMNRRNLAVVGNEIINFGNVEENSQGHWSLSSLLRGRKGSPIDAHAVGERFVLLERQQLWFLDADLVELNEELTFRVTSLGSQNSSTETVTFTGQSQTEREPAYLSADRDGGDVVITWQGVGRLGGGVHVAMGSYFQNYRVTVNGTSYTTTDQSIAVTDPGGALEIEVRQVNSLTGEGPAATVNI